MHRPVKYETTDPPSSKSVKLGVSLAGLHSFKLLVYVDITAKENRTFSVDIKGVKGPKGWIWECDSWAHRSSMYFEVSNDDEFQYNHSVYSDPGHVKTVIHTHVYAMC